MELGGRDVRKKLAELQLGRDHGAVCKSPECSSPEWAKPLITTRINNFFLSLRGCKSGLLCLQSVCCAVAGGSSEGSHSCSGPQCVSYSPPWRGILFALPLGNQSIPSMIVISTTPPHCANWSCRCLMLLKPGLFWDFNFHFCSHSEGLWPRTRPPHCTWHKCQRDAPCSRVFTIPVIFNPIVKSHNASCLRTVTQCSWTKMHWETRSPLGDHTSVRNTLVCKCYTNDLQRCCPGLGLGGKRGFVFLVCSCSVSGISLISELLASHPRAVHQRNFLAVSFNSWCIFSSLMLCKLWLLFLLRVSNLILHVSIRIHNRKLPIYCFFLVVIIFYMFRNCCDK